MGFREGAWATVWEVKKNPSGRSFNVNLSTSKKDRDTGEYETDWSGYAMFAGDAAKKAATLKRGDRIKLNGCEVTTKYVKEQEKKYTNYTVWDYEPSEFSSGGGKKSKPVDDEDYISEDSLPF